jgi:2-keto-4-pentenoate hydratase
MTPATPPPADSIARCAAALYEAERTRRTVAPFSPNHPELDEVQAYAIQAAGLALRGQRPIGYKLGYTSAAMRAQMNIDHPNFGVLTDAMRIDPGTDRVASAQLIHPLVEPEIALLVGRRIEGTGHDRNSIWRHVDAVLPALEIVDTRYHEYKFAIVDNIADNSSAARFVTGAPRSLRRCADLRLTGVLLSRNGVSLDHGIGANAMGDPLLALAWLANFLGARDATVEEGALVLTGGLTRAHAAQPGQVVMGEFGQLGLAKACFD